jgi:glucose dehydrogenase
MAMVRKFAGLALAVAGIAIVIDILPGYLWILLLGFGLIWAGWLVFRMERIY